MKIKDIGGGVWLVDSQRKLVPRKRARVNSKEEAQALLKEWLHEARMGGSVGFLDITVRSHAQRALVLLKQVDATENLAEAVDWFVKRKYPEGGARTVEQLVEEFIASKEEQKIRGKDGEEKPRYSEFYLRSLHRFRQFSKVYGTMKVYSIRPGHVKDWLAGLDLNDFSKKQYYQYLGMLWGYAHEKKYIADNPMLGVVSPHVITKDPVILSMSDAKNFLECSWDEFDQVYYPFLVLGLFCGIRPHEIVRLKWQDIKPNHMVRISADIAKTGSVRNVHIPLNAQMMLAGFRQFHQDIKPTDPLMNVGYHRYRYDFRRLRKRAGIKSWTPDSLRHTFASYYYSATTDMPKLIERMGHATPKMALKHYINLAGENWLDYFTLLPDVNLKEELNTLLENTCKVQDGPVRVWSRKKLLETLNL